MRWQGRQTVNKKKKAFAVLLIDKRFDRAKLPAKIGKLTRSHGKGGLKGEKKLLVTHGTNTL